MKLRYRINLYTSVLIISLLIFLNLTVYLLFKSIILEEEIKTAQAEFDNIHYGITNALGIVPTNDLLMAYVPIDGAIQIIKEDSTRIGLVTSFEEQELSHLNSNYFIEGKTETITLGDQHYYFQSIPTIWSDGSIVNIQIAKSIQNAYEQVKILGFVLIAATLIATLPIIASGILLGRIILNPISNMIRTMREIIQSGKFKKLEIEQKSQDELTEMGDTFNSMIDLLENNYRKQEQFVSNASHELKTPLTVIESYASLLKRRGLDNPKLFTESVEAIHSEAHRMIEMTEQLLLLAKPQQQWNLELQSTMLSEIASEIVQSFQRAHRRKIIFEKDSDATIITDPKKLEQLVYIFIDNALKYSEEEISIIIGKTDEKGYFRIIDRGIGIPKEEIPKIFDRFYRVDTARTRKKGGTGLGLSLAKDISDAIQAQVEVDSVVGVGTSVTIYLPLSKEE